MWRHWSSSHFLIVVALVSLWGGAAPAAVTVFQDDFSTDTTAGYTWFEEGSGGDGNPHNNYTYDPANQWVTITTGDNANVYMGASVSGSLPTDPTSGYFEMSFMPMTTYPVDGLTQMRLYGAGGTSDMYLWHFAHDSGAANPGSLNQYRARLEKWVGGTPVIQEAFVPSPSHYDLGQWHTLAMSFGPAGMTGYLDGQLIMSFADPTGASIPIVGFDLVFMQQDGHIDNILLETDPAPIPVPGSALLAAIGLGIARFRRTRRV